MATYTVNLFTTLDGFGTGLVAYWGKDGPKIPSLVWERLLACGAHP